MKNTIIKTGLIILAIIFFGIIPQAQEPTKAPTPEKTETVKAKAAPVEVTEAPAQVEASPAAVEATEAEKQSGESVLKGLLISMLFNYFTTTASFTLGITALVTWVFSILKLSEVKNYIKQLITLAMSVLGSLLGYWLSVGIFAEVSVTAAILIGVQISFTSNGLFALGKNLLKNR